MTRRRELLALFPDVLTASAAYAWLLGLCVFGIVVVQVTGRAPLPTALATGGLVAQVLLSLVLRLTVNARPTRAALAWRVAAVILFGLLTAPMGWFFGPNSGFAALVALFLALSGVLADEEAGLSGHWYRWLTWSTLALSQAGVFVLVRYRVLPDDSLAPTLIARHPMWHHTVAHAAIQGVYLGAFLLGVAVRRRYEQLWVELDEALRTASLRQVLLEEAREDYRRAVALGREESYSPAAIEQAGRGLLEDTAVISPSVDVEETSGISPDPLPPVPAAAPPSPREANAPIDVSRLWQRAYETKMRTMYMSVIALCGGGMVLLGLIAGEPAPLRLAWVCMIVAAAALWLHARGAGRRADGSFHWPLAVAAVFTIGPAYSFGLHSGFACVPALLLFFGGPFRVTQRTRWFDQHVGMLVVGSAAYAVAFVLIVTGVIPDHGNVPVKQPGMALWELVTLHGLEQLVFLAAYLSGTAIDARLGTLLGRLEAAARDAAQKEALLLVARAEIDQILGAGGSGIFSDQRIGRYRVGPLLGRGGMGEVYAATEEPGGRRVALKMIRRDRLLQPETFQLFASEATALTRVESPCVARVLDVGLGGELPYLAMEPIDGRSLAAILRERGRLPVAELAGLVRDLTLGLRHAHEAGVLHRDVKPQNIMLTRSDAGERWKLVDFGVAEVLTGGSTGRLVVGTPLYMAPEQARGERIDTRADLYSLCLVIYRALTGRPAFTREHARDQGPPDPAYWVPVGVDVVLALRIGLAHAKDDRFASAVETGHAFAAAFEGRLRPDLRERALHLLDREPWARPDPADDERPMFSLSTG